MNKIQIIYSTSENGQYVANVPYQAAIFETKSTFIFFAKTLFMGKFCFLGNKWKDELSARIIAGEGAHIPEDISPIPADLQDTP